VVGMLAVVLALALLIAFRLRKLEPLPAAQTISPAS